MLVVRKNVCLERVGQDCVVVADLLDSLVEFFEVVVTHELWVLDLNHQLIV